MRRWRRSVRTLTVTTLRVDVERVKEFVAYHRALGVDEMMLFFDDPSDPAIAVVRGVPGVTAIACDEGYWSDLRGSRPPRVQGRQLANVNATLRSRRGEFDWLMHIDSDELIHAPLGLGATLKEEGAGLSLLQLPVLEAIPRDLDDRDPFRSTEHFRRHRPELEDRARELKAASGYMGSDFLRGHVKGKPAVRMDGVVSRLRLHEADQYDEALFRAGTSEGIDVLHYDSGSFDDWCTKWRNRDGFGRTGHKGSRLEQWDEFARLDALGDEVGLRDLYRRYFMIPAEELPVLRSIGLVQRVDLDPAWFDWPA